MSHSQFHSIKLILRHAWLSLWDKHMTTGRINQVSIVMFTATSDATTRPDLERLNMRRELRISVMPRVGGLPQWLWDAPKSVLLARLLHLLAFLVGEALPRVIPTLQKLGGSRQRASSWAEHICTRRTDNPVPNTSSRGNPRWVTDR